MAVYIVFALLFLLPFIVFPFGVSYFETPKIFVAQCLIQLLLLTQILRKDFRINDLDKRLLLLCGGFFVLSIVNYFLYPSSVAFFGNVFRLQGIYLFWHFLIFTILSVRIGILDRGKLFFLGAMSLELVSALALGQAASGRYYGTLGEAHSLAAFALFLFPVALFSPIKLPKNQRTLFSFAGFFLAFVLILLSGSRSGMIGLFIECFFLLLTFKTSIRNALIIGVILFAGSLLLPFFTPQERWENRRDVWITGAIAGWEKPISGWGVGNIEVAYKSVAPKVPNLIRYQYVDSSHNFFLDSFIQGGVIGLGIILGILYIGINKFIGDKNKRNLMILLGLVSVMSFNPVSVTILIVFWWVVGQGFGKVTSNK